VKVTIYGAGQVGTAVGRLLAQRAGYEVLGPWDRSRREEALRSGADVVVIATTSFLSEVGPDIRLAVISGSNVITTAEEAAFPWYFDSEFADDLDALARSQGVSILGAGLNPGFAFDSLVLTAAGVTSEVDTIRVERVVDLSGFSTSILRRLGIGFDRAAFTAGVAGGTITGHIGFPQSMRVVARRMGAELTAIERSIEPLEADVEYRVGDMVVAPGESAGFRQHYVGIFQDQPWFHAFFLGHLDPQGIGHPPRDEIVITSEAPPLRLVIEPGINPQVGAPRVIANSLDRLVAAFPGWLTVGELPPATPVAKRS
jgi:2,4-diaminopentanoate dehydrogenase